jgi:hypothetical protein
MIMIMLHDHDCDHDQMMRSLRSFFSVGVSFLSDVRYYSYRYVTVRSVVVFVRPPRLPKASVRHHVVRGAPRPRGSRRRRPWPTSSPNTHCQPALGGSARTSGRNGFLRGLRHNNSGVTRSGPGAARTRSRSRPFPPRGLDTAGGAHRLRDDMMRRIPSVPGDFRDPWTSGNNRFF